MVASEYHSSYQDFIRNDGQLDPSNLNRWPPKQFTKAVKAHADLSDFISRSALRTADELIDHAEMQIGATAAMT